MGTSELDGGRRRSTFEMKVRSLPPEGLRMPCFGGEDQETRVDRCIITISLKRGCGEVGTV